MKVTRQQIDDFLKEKRIAMAGVSRDPKKFGYQVFKELQNKGYHVLPINPKTESIDSVRCFADVNELPPDIDSLLIVTPKNQTDKILRNAINRGIKNIWVQQMSETEETLKIAEEYEKEIIHRKCIFMFTEPVTSIHKFHRTLMKIFRMLPA